MKKSRSFFTILITLPFLFLNCAPEPKNEGASEELKATKTAAIGSALNGCYAANITGDLIDKSGVQDKMDELALDFLKAMASMISFKVCFQNNGYAKFDGSFGPFSSDDYSKDSIAYQLKENMLIFDKTDNVDVDTIPIRFTDFGFIIEADSLDIEMHKE